MKCCTRHMTWAKVAQCEYQYARVRGEGRYAVIVPSVRWELILFEHQRQALKFYAKYQHLGARLRVLARHGVIR